MIIIEKVIFFVILYTHLHKQHKIKTKLIIYYDKKRLWFKYVKINLSVLITKLSLLEMWWFFYYCLVYPTATANMLGFDVLASTSSTSYKRETRTRRDQISIKGFFIKTVHSTLHYIKQLKTQLYGLKNILFS